MRILLNHAYRTRFDEYPRNRVHRHSYFEPCVVLGGHGEFLHGTQRYPLEPGDLFLAEPGVFHEITSLPSRDLDVAFALFGLGSDGGHADPVQDDIIRSFVRSHEVFASQQHALGSELAAIAAHTVTSDETTSYLDRERVRIAVLEMMRVLAPTSPHSSPTLRESPVVQRAVRAIEARLDGPVRVAELAREAGTSERNLRHLFRRHLHRTVVQEVQHRRIQRACALLHDGMRVCDAASHVGIADLGQFSRLFKHVMGVTPGAFRRLRAPFENQGVGTGEIPVEAEFIEPEIAGASG